MGMKTEVFHVAWQINTKVSEERCSFHSEITFSLKLEAADSSGT
jgi:hypothetical protein